MSFYEQLSGKPFFLQKAQLAYVKEMLADMTVDEKIGQLFHLVTYSDHEEELKRICLTYKPGGVMARKMPYTSACRVSNTLQKYSKIPVLISANLEAGGDGMIAEGTSVGPNMMVGAGQDAAFAAKQGQVASREGVSVGANCAFAPVIDIDYNFRNPITNTRLYSSDAAFVANAGAAFIKAVQKNGMCAVAKHFPGDGVDERDQHLVTSINSLSCEEWDNAYGMAYRAAIDAGVMAIMVGHIMLPAYGFS